MRIVHSPGELESLQGGVFVPTMGALHQGHCQLVRRASTLRPPGRPVVVSIFVNPTQFNDPSDLARYPRTLEADVAACRDAGADVVFAPPVEVIYPPGLGIKVPRLPRVATDPGLEDLLRPGHFAGVCQVVARLFELVRPASALFGEKDWQQLQVIRAMTRELGLGVSIVPVETVREPDGLAMSSRNVFLSPDERVRARAVPRALQAARGFVSPHTAELVMRRELEAGGFVVEYAVVRDADALGPVRIGSPARALIAARLPSVRLIDNAPWGEESHVP